MQHNYNKDHDDDLDEDDRRYNSFTPMFAIKGEPLASSPKHSYQNSPTYAGYGQSFNNFKNGPEGYNGHVAGFGQGFDNFKQGNEGYNGHPAGFGNFKNGLGGYNGQYAGYDQTIGNFKQGGEAYNGNYVAENGYGKESYNGNWNGVNDYSDHGGMYPNYGDKYSGSWAAQNVPVENSGGYNWSPPVEMRGGNWPNQGAEKPKA
ncbi:hypothetical protein ABTG41_19115, partial [Acinetobacter baumannii]